MMRGAFAVGRSLLLMGMTALKIQGPGTFALGCGGVRAVFLIVFTNKADMHTAAAPREMAL